MNLIHFPTPCPGTVAVYAVKAEWPMPVGHIYFRQVLSHHFDILDCFVQPTFRRQGICTAMFFRLKAWYPDSTFITQQASRHSQPWLLKMGFEKRADGWWLPAL